MVNPGFLRPLFIMLLPNIVGAQLLHEAGHWSVIMKRVGFLLKVKEEKIAEYKLRHRQVWPEMLEALSRTGWHNYSLFMRDDGLLFGYFETPESFQVALEGMDQEAINDKWQAFMAPYFESADGSHADKMMVELEELFHLD